MKKKFLIVGSTISALALPVSAFAESAGTANSEVVTAVTGVASDMTATANAVIPIALSVVGIGMVVIFGVRIFQRITRKA